MLNMGRALRDLDRPDDALRILQQALELEPNNPEVHHVMGVLHEQMGDREQAADSFRSAISVAPGMAIAHYYLAQLRGRETSAEEFEQLMELWQRDAMLDNDRMFLAFAIARASEKRGDHEQAFHFIEQGNRIKAQQQPYDDADTARFLEALAGSAQRALDRLGPEPGQPDERPVFVLGMPRSGTSLTEQILASHGEVAGTGELSYAYDAAHRVRDMTRQKFPENLDLLSAGQFRELGGYYLSRHQNENLAFRRFVDKTPLNFQYIGLLALALPGARFVHCHRDPVQNCYSIHKIPFDKKQAYAHSLEALGMYYSRYWQLMQRWKAMFPGRILDLAYEETVTDTEGQARRLADFLGLEFEPRMLDFHRSERLVKTPSASQVRQPIYSSALESWRPYASHLAPLIEHLAPELRPAQISE
jgi:tetratricopeptide (TPR) repeat protein